MLLLKCRNVWTVSLADNLEVFGYKVLIPKKILYVCCMAGYD